MEPIDIYNDFSIDDLVFDSYIHPITGESMNYIMNILNKKIYQNTVIGKNNTRVEIIRYYYIGKILFKPSSDMYSNYTDTICFIFSNNTKHIYVQEIDVYISKYNMIAA